jgi:hypothetical protein
MRNDMKKKTFEKNINLNRKEPEKHFEKNE